MAWYSLRDEFAELSDRKLNVKALRTFPLNIPKWSVVLISLSMMVKLRIFVRFDVVSFIETVIDDGLIKTKEI